MTNAIECNLSNLSTDFLNFILHDVTAQEILKDSRHFSLIQYSNPPTIVNHIEVSVDIYNGLLRLPRHYKYLNLGMGAGFLERIVKLHNNKLDIESVEWDEQRYIFKNINDRIDVEPQYICNDITKDNFNIIDCATKYDYILLIRFFPLNRINASLNEVKQILLKLKKYSDKVILFDFHKNYTEETRDYFNNIKCKKTKMHKKYEPDNWILDLNLISES